MSENETADAAPAKKPVPKKAKPAPKASGLSKPLARTLAIIVKAKRPLTRADVAKATAKAGIACFNGRISNESATYAALLDGGFIREKKRVDETAGINEVVYEATAKGEKEIAGGK